MEICKYKEILTNANIANVNENKKNTYKPLLRQMMISSGVWCIYFMQGLYLGAPTVIVAQIRREANSKDAVTDELSSWLASLPVISAAPLLFILPWIFYKIGRKYTYLFVCLLAIISFLIFFISTNVYHILISQVFLGATIAAVNTFLPIIITEYTSPKYRGIFLTFKSASTFWGIWVSNAIGTFFHWKNIALVAFMCSAYLITVFSWPESPYWLAMKCRYAESAESHRWLKGVDKNSEMELAMLINSQKKLSISNDKKDFGCFSSLSTMWCTITSRPFYKPALICMALFTQYQFSGKLVISIYAIEVLKSLTQDESVAYKGMLILDGVTVFSMYGGCILSRYFKRRTLMLLFASTGILFLYLMSFYSFLVSLSLIQENHILIIFILTAFSISIGCGPIILASSIYGEIVPSQYQGPIMILSGSCTIIIMSILLKISPFMFEYLKMHGCFLFFATSSTVILIILYIYLPETKDKTVHEIEHYLADHEKSVDCSSVKVSEPLLHTEEHK